MPCRREIPSHVVVRALPAVTHIAVAVRKREHEATDFSGKGMMLLITSTVQPPDWSCRAGRRQGVQQRHHSLCSYSCTEQDHRSLAGLQKKAAARRADVERMADSDMLAKVPTGRAVRLDLHADPIALRRYGTRERKAAIKRPAGHCLKTQYHVLARQSSWQRLTSEAAHRQ